MFEGHDNFYSVLDLTPTASTQEIKSAYLKLKMTYRKENLGLYSMVESTDVESLSRQLEEAYKTLSDPDQRREYDLRLGLSSRPSETKDSSNMFSEKAGPFRTASPFEDEEDAILNPPTTEFAPPISEVKDPKRLDSLANFDLSEGDFETQIRNEREWRGSFLRKVREFRRITIDELSGRTKISRNYLNAVEEESYDKLPAAVFVRGFVTQYAKNLKLPVEDVLSAFMSRFKK